MKYVINKGLRASRMDVLERAVQIVMLLSLGGLMGFYVAYRAILAWLV